MFKCECGREFENGQSFNGHKSHCKVHQLAKYGTLDLLISAQQKKAVKAHKTFLVKQEQKKLQAEADWAAEQHICEACGKIMTEKFGSGRFCSRACANGRIHSEETKQKIADKLVIKFTQNNSKYFCTLCGKKIRPNKTGFCGNCLRYSVAGKQLLANTMRHFIETHGTANLGGLRPGAGYGKHGTYKGYWCDSTYELVYIIYCIDHNINIKRNTSDAFMYTYNGKIHRYYPDFIVNNEYVEIKGYHTDLVDIKTDSVVMSGKTIKVLYKNDLQYAFDYVKNHYVYKTLTDLYQ